MNSSPWQTFGAWLGAELGWAVQGINTALHNQRTGGAGYLF